MFTNQWSQCKTYCNRHFLFIWVILVLIAIAINVTIRFWLWRDAKKSQDMETTKSRYGRMEFTITIFIILFSLATALTSVLSQKNGDPFIVRLIFLSNMCVTLPLLVFLSKPNMRAAALMKLRQCGFNYDISTSTVCPV